MNLNYFVVEPKTFDLCVSVLRGTKKTQLSDFLAHVPNNFKTEDFYLQVLKENADIYDLIDQTKMSPEFKTKVVSVNYKILQKIPYEEQTFELVKEAVDSNPLALNYAHIALTEDLYLQAIKKNVWMLKNISPQTEALCLEAVKINGTVLEYIKHQTPEMCLIALKNNEESYQFVKVCSNPDYKTTLKGVESLLEIGKNKKLVKSTISGIKDES